MTDTEINIAIAECLGLRVIKPPFIPSSIDPAASVFTREAAKLWRHYYNENDPKTAAWLRELIRAGVIPEGHVDERSICDVRPADLAGYTQCHFFAGVAGWSYALRLAGWPDDRPVWTGSCPCQPFSAAGKGKGADDERHLWPVFFDLIRQCRPQHVFGEQVANAVGHGWLDGVSTDLESQGYAVGAVVLGAHSVGAPHPRQRLYWVANMHGQRCDRERIYLQPRGSQQAGFEAAGSGPTDGLANAMQSGRAEGRTKSGRGSTAGSGGAGRMEHATGRGADATEQRGRGLCAESSGFWSDFRIIHCLDGKARRIGTGIQPLAHGVPGRVGLLRGYGNAIVPQVAAEFIRACDESI